MEDASGQSPDCCLRCPVKELIGSENKVLPTLTAAFPADGSQCPCQQFTWGGGTTQALTPSKCWVALMAQHVGIALPPWPWSWAGRCSYTTQTSSEGSSGAEILCCPAVWRVNFTQPFDQMDLISTVMNSVTSTSSAFTFNLNKLEQAAGQGKLN